MRHRTLHAAAAAAALLTVPAGVLAQQQEPSLPAPAPPQSQAEKPPLKPLKPKPALRRAVVIDVARGRVTFQLPGDERRRSLTGPTSVPMQTIVDAEDGRVRLTVARDQSGRTDRGVFYDGRFRLSQGRGRRPITHLRLLGEFDTACSSKRAASGATAAAKPRRRRLWGNGKGRFRTRGRYSAATVRGTKWLVEDRCDSTLTRVARGEVEVIDFSSQGPSLPSRENGADSVGGAPAPASAPGQSRPRRVRVRRGGSYTAGPGQ